MVREINNSTEYGSLIPPLPIYIDLPDPLWGDGGFLGLALNQWLIRLV